MSLSSNRNGRVCFDEQVALTASRVELETTKKLMQMDLDELTTAVQSLAPEIERLETTLDDEMEELADFKQEMSIDIQLLTASHEVGDSS